MPADVSRSRCASARAGGPTRRFRGLIDDVRVYGRVLDEQEIAALALGESIDRDRAQAGGRSEAQIEEAALRSYFLENAAPRKFAQAWEQLTALRLRKRTSWSAPSPL